MVLATDPETRISASSACAHPWIVKYTEIKTPLPITISDPSFESTLKYALKHWALKTIVPSNELAEYHMMFINIDQDFDGVIARHELERILDGDSCEKIIQNADCNSNGVLEYHEFLSVVVGGETIKKYSKQIIEELDKDNSGKILVQSLMSFLEYSIEAGFNGEGMGEISNSEILALICN
jgi:Ca2+-binding EF-hand superfamily protein